jgi:hypothetical protein
VCFVKDVAAFPKLRTGPTGLLYVRMYTHEDVCQGSAAAVGGDYSWTGAVQTGPAGGGDGGGSMGLETHGVLAQDYPVFSPRALCAFCTNISHAVCRQGTGTSIHKCKTRCTNFLLSVYNS